MKMFTIPHNIILVIGAAIVLLTLGFVVYGFIKGWKNVMPEYKGAVSEYKGAEDEK